MLPIILFQGGKYTNKSPVKIKLAGKIGFTSVCAIYVRYKIFLLKTSNDFKLFEFQGKQ